MQFVFHKKFQLNNRSFSTKEEILLFSKTISLDVFSFLSDFLSDSTNVTVQTSGSTGTPKLLKIKKEFMINSAISTGSFFNLNEGTTILLCMNPTFIAGKMMLVRAMKLGWNLTIVKPSINPLKGIENLFDFCAMVPLQVHHSFNDLHKIKKLIIGGGVISKELESKLQTINTEVFATYGMTETVTHIAVKRIRNYEFGIGNYELGVGNYQALPNVQFSQDKRGCLVIDAPKVAENIVVTNDLVRLISDTEFQWLGRFDNIINSGGIKLIPEQIEKKLATIINNRFFVAGIKDDVLGEKMVLVVEFKRRKGTKSMKSKEEDMKDVFMRKIQHLKLLSKYEIPKEIYFVKQFIETETKKIQRKKTLDLVFT